MKRKWKENYFDQPSKTDKTPTRGRSRFWVGDPFYQWDHVVFDVDCHFYKFCYGLITPWNHTGLDHLPAWGAVWSSRRSSSIPPPVLITLYIESVISIISSKIVVIAQWVWRILIRGSSPTLKFWRRRCLVVLPFIEFASLWAIRAGK